MILQKGPKGWVGKHKGQLYLTKKQDIGDAIEFIYAKHASL